MNIQILQGDITKLEVDVIVNAANTSLLGGGGVDGAIHKVGGKAILEECRKIRNKQGGCKVGEAVITNAGNLKAKKVIHTVGPRWNDGNTGEPEKLQNCYLNSLKIADDNKLLSIAFPNISTGIYGYPKEAAARVAIQTVQNYRSKTIEQVFFVCFDRDNFEIYLKSLNTYQQK